MSIGASYAPNRILANSVAKSTDPTGFAGEISDSASMCGMGNGCVAALTDVGQR